MAHRITERYAYYSTRPSGRAAPQGAWERYFQQLHSGMIYNLQDQLQDMLNERGYQIGKEASLQIFAHRKPDLFVQRAGSVDEPLPRWDYALAAAEILGQKLVEKGQIMVVDR